MEHRVAFRGTSGRSPDREVEVVAGTSLLAATQRVGLPIARACGGDALCGRCGLEVLEGTPALSAETEAERETKRRNRVAPGLRLACCAEVRGPVTVRASYW